MGSGELVEIVRIVVISFRNIAKKIFNEIPWKERINVTLVDEDERGKRVGGESDYESVKIKYKTRENRDRLFNESEMERRGREGESVKAQTKDVGAAVGP